MSKHTYSRWCGCPDCMNRPDDEPEPEATTGRDLGELADEEMERRKDRARDDLDFYGETA
jgi:hypothetical protein